MKNTIVTLLIALSSTLIYAQELHWIGSEENRENVSDGTSTSDCGFTAFGTETDKLFTRYDLLGIKVNDSGTLEWTSKYSDAHDNYCSFVINGPNNAFLVGGSKSSKNLTSVPTLTSINKTGVVEWTLRLDSFGLEVASTTKAIYNEKKGIYMVFGYYGEPDKKIFWCGVEPDGKVVWLRRKADFQYQRMGKLFLDKEGELLVPFQVSVLNNSFIKTEVVKMNDQGEEIWSTFHSGINKNVVGNDIIEIDETIYVAGCAGECTGGGYTDNLMAFAVNGSTGQKKWFKEYVKNGSQFFPRIYATQGDGLSVIGHSATGAQLTERGHLILRVDQNSGNEEWSETLNRQIFRSFLLSEDTVLLVGKKDQQFELTTFDVSESGGNILTEDVLPHDYQNLRGISSDPCGNLWMTGNVGNKVSGSSDADMFILRVKKNELGQLTNVDANTILLSPVNINEPTIAFEESIRNWPNPFSVRTTFDLSKLEKSQEISLQIFDIRGSLVLQRRYPATTNAIEITAREIGTGVFIYKIQSEAHTYRGKIKSLPK